jgi:hypothetical protein
MIPDYELNVMLLAEVEASDLAREGEVAAGYDCLLAGLHRAQEAQERDEAGADELVLQWQMALDNYCKRFGARIL